jgi:hypothetical protein
MTIGLDPFRALGRQPLGPGDHVIGEFLDRIRRVGHELRCLVKQLVQSLAVRVSLVMEPQALPEHLAESTWRLGRMNRLSWWPGSVWAYDSRYTSPTGTGSTCPSRTTRHRTGRRRPGAHRHGRPEPPVR